MSQSTDAINNLIANAKRSYFGGLVTTMPEPEIIPLKWECAYCRRMNRPEYDNCHGCGAPEFASRTAFPNAPRAIRLMNNITEAQWNEAMAKQRDVEMSFYVADVNPYARGNK